MRVKKSIECYIFRENSKGFIEILLLHKPETHRHPAFWQPITGGVEMNEESVHACIREVKEETDLDVDKSSIEDLNFEFEIFMEECDLIIKKSLFICKINDSLKKVKISDEHDDFMWTNLEKVKEYLFWESNKKSFKKLYNKLTG